MTGVFVPWRSVRMALLRSAPPCSSRMTQARIMDRGFPNVSNDTSVAMAWANAMACSIVLRCATGSDRHRPTTNVSAAAFSMTSPGSVLTAARAPEAVGLAVYLNERHIAGTARAPSRGPPTSTVLSPSVGEQDLVTFPLRQVKLPAAQLAAGCVGTRRRRLNCHSAPADVEELTPAPVADRRRRHHGHAAIADLAGTNVLA